MFPTPRFVVGAMLAGVIVASASPRVFAEELKVGDKAPAFKLEGTDGKVHELSQYMGKQPVVIAWFPKAKTGGCTKECKSFRDSAELLKSKNVAFFTASCDVPSFNAEFAGELKLNYPILSDPTGEVAKAFGVINPARKVPFRWTFYIDKEGVVRHIDKSVNVTSHGADVAKKIDQLKLVGE